MDAWHDNGNRIECLSCSRWTQKRRREETRCAHECVVEPEANVLDEEGNLFALFSCVWLCLSRNWVIGMSVLKSKLNERQQLQKESLQRVEEDEVGRGWDYQCSVEWAEKLLLFAEMSDPTVEILTAIKNAVGTGFNFLVTEEENITTPLETVVIRVIALGTASLW